MRRSVLALVLAVVVSGFGSLAIAAEPAPSPSAVPGDPSERMPREIGGTALSVRVLTGSDALAGSTGAEAIEAVLADLGKTRDDLSIVQAFTPDPSTPPAYVINGFRVDGVDGQVLFEGMWRQAAESAGLPPDLAPPLEFIGDRTVWPIYRGADNEWMVIYPSGELLVMAGGAGGSSLGAAMPSLP